MLATPILTPKFEIRIYDCPRYDILSVKRRTGIYYVRVGQVLIALMLLILLALAGGVKTVAGTLISRIQHNIEVLYLLAPVLMVVVAVIAEDAVRFFKELV